MKSGKRFVALLCALSLGLTMRAELQSWVQHLAAGPLIPVFFRTVPMPGGSIEIRRPPKETIANLGAKIAAAPNDAALYRLRASEEELALDFTAAETDWRKYAQMAGDHRAAYIELADYFHRRVQPLDEIKALQVSGDGFERILAVADAAWVNGSPPIKNATYRAWIAHDPKEPFIRKQYIEYLTRSAEPITARAEIAAYTRAFPDDRIYPIEARANVALETDSAQAAIRIYDQAFEPLWPTELAKSYFELLSSEGRLRDFTGRARNSLQTDPTDLKAAARLFHYYLFQNNTVAARRALMEVRLAKESRKQRWSAEELRTMALLFDRIQDSNEAARFYYALYSLPGATPSDAETALGGLTALLFAYAGEGLRFGSADLSFYKDIASVDTSPGFLNGILSLVLSSTAPRWAYAQEDQISVAYFQRARAAELVDLFDSRFPRSGMRPALHASLIQTYAIYGDDDAILRSGRAFMTSFPNAAERVTVGLLMADAYARQSKTAEEFAIYDQLLRELAAKAHGMPLANDRPATVALLPAIAPMETLPPPFLMGRRAQLGQPDQSHAPQPEGYANILDRYLSRLAAMNRPMDALRVYRREIDRNPNDSGLYERLAAFLDQNGMAGEVEDTYRRAIAKFPDRSWYDRLARWYLRQKRASSFETLTHEIVGIFSGTELEKYFEQVVAPASLNPVLYRQLNVYAHERFPEDLVFVRNLLNAYSRTETYDAAASDRLLRAYWYYEPDLKNRLFERLSSSGSLYAELDAVRKQNPGIAAGNAKQVVASNPAAAEFSAEAEAWLSHFEAAAPELRSLAEAYPGQRMLTGRASAIYRSLAAYDPIHIETAASLAEAEHRADPRDASTLARIGDIYADRERFDRARAFWNRMPAIEPGNPDGYLEAATVFWDYYHFDDALRLIRKARVTFDDPTLFAYQAGAIYENQRNPARAVKEYIAGATEGDESAERRLLRLAARPAVKDVVYDLTTSAPLKLRAEVLARQQRTAELEIFLLSRAANAGSAEILTTIGDLASSYGLDKVEERSMDRRVALTSDPVEKMRLRIELAKLYERKQDTEAAKRNIDELYRDNPLILGVIRAAVDFYTRTKRPERAVAVLVDAAAHARGDLANQFTLEAANIAVDAGEVERARTLLNDLLKADPYNGQYLAAMAASYSKARDDRGLRDYQLATIELIRNAPLPPAERTERIAGLRRTLIPSMTRLNDFEAAVDQYIQVLNRYPEDDSLAREALLYAAAHNRTAQLLDFYRKTIAEAPRDYRWSILLGRLETYAEDYPAAIRAYDLAMKARPDRADVVQARAQLEERLMRFDDALRTYSRLYELTYRDPQWMRKIAELHARLRRPDEAVTALKSAIIGSKSETADMDFEIASELEGWNLIPQAVQFVDRGVHLGGGAWGERRDLRTYASVLTRARRLQEVLEVIGRDERLEYAAGEVGAAVAIYYTPEEKAALGKVPPWLTMPAGLASLEVQWRYEAMMKPGGSLDAQLIKLQCERGEYEELAHQLESFATVPSHSEEAAAALSQAANAYIALGDVEAQLRIMRLLRDRHELTSMLLDRYLALTAATRPDELIAFIRNYPSNDARNRAVQFAIASESEPLALRAVESRGSVLTPVWLKAYTTLTGLHYADSSSAIAAAFSSALDTRTIGERVRSPLKRDEQLAGGVWFYYGARYGEYLELNKKPAAANYLPATVERSPGNPNAYLALGDFYAEIKKVPKALAQFEDVLQLDPTRGDAEDHIARLLWENGRHADAIAHWRSATAIFLRQESAGVRVPEEFWTHVREALADIGRAHAVNALRVDIERLLGDYIARNGAYRANELVEAAYNASTEAGADPGWIVALTRNNDEAEILLSALLRIPQLTDEQRIEMQTALVAAIGRDRARDDEKARQELQLVSLLLNAGKVKQAGDEWMRLPEATRNDGRNQDVQEVRIRLAAADGTLPALLDAWRSSGNVSTDALQRAAIDLREKNKEASLAVLEFVYRWELGRGALDSANFLGLAEVLLERGDTTGAVQQLRRMVLVVSDPFETLLPAADLLAKFGKNSQAVEFVRQRVHAVPWDAAARLRLLSLAPAADRANRLVEIASDPQVRYAIRVKAARMSALQSITAQAGTELGMLSQARILPGEARKPYYVFSRVAAAQNTSDAATRFNLLGEALSIVPSDADIRLAAGRAALEARHDSLGLAILRTNIKVSDPALLERLGEAAERLGDLHVAAEYFRSAKVELRLKAVETELVRRAMNAARQPVIKNVVEQDTIVRPRIARRPQ